MSFTITGARGRVILTVASPMGAVKTIRTGATDLLGVPLKLAGTEKIDDIEIIMSTNTGWLRGTVVGADGRAAENTQVVVFSADNPRLWFVPYIQVTRSMAAGLAAGAARPASGASAPGWRPSAPGDFLVGRLLPGRYYVAAVDNDAAGFLVADAAVLERLKARATTVTIVAGEATRVELTQ